MYEEERVLEDSQQSPEEKLEGVYQERLQEELELARAAWEQEAELRIAKARMDAEKLARMTGEERRQHEWDEREKHLEEREKALEVRELRQEALRLMEQKKLPAVLVDAVNCSDRGEMEKGVKALEQAFFAAVSQAVEERMRGTVPQAGQMKGKSDMTDDEYYESRFHMGR